MAKVSKKDILKATAVIAAAASEETDVVDVVRTIVPFRKSIEVQKVDSKHGLVFGWAIICKIDGEEYYDTDGDHIPEAAMLEAATEFMAKSREHRDSHGDTAEGMVVHSMILTEDIAKASGIETKQTGWFVGVKPNPELLAKFESGECTGFSIGGKRIEDEPIPDVEAA